VLVKKIFIDITYPFKKMWRGKEVWKRVTLSDSLSNNVWVRRLK